MAERTLPDVANAWVKEANSALGSLPEGTAPAAWVVSRLLEWLHVEAGAQLADAERATAATRAALTAAGGWSDPRLAAAMDELTHLEESLEDLAVLLGLPDRGSRLTASGTDAAVPGRGQS